MLPTLRMKAPFLLHRLDEPQSVAWFLSESHRRRVGSILSKKYGQDFGILNAAYQLIARVDRRGAVTLLPPPFAEYHFSLISNKPSPKECPCAGFYDPEVQGPWRLRNLDGEHHPLCQFDQVSTPVYDEAARRATERTSQGLSAQARPDEWVRLREKHRSR